MTPRGSGGIREITDVRTDIGDFPDAGRRARPHPEVLT